MNQKQFLLLLCFFYSAVVSSQSFDANIANIPDTLRVNAYSVVRDYVIEMNQSSTRVAEYKVRRVVTILNKKGQDAAIFSAYTDQFQSLTRFAGRIYNSAGVELFKLKSKDLKETQYSSMLGSDTKTRYYVCEYARYPYTIEYEWTIKIKNGLLVYPTFCPIESYNQSLQHAEYSINIPTSVDVNCKEQLVDRLPSTLLNNQKQCKWEVNQINAVVEEDYGPNLLSIIPRVYANPLKFEVDGYAGGQQTWQELGAWTHSLQNGLNQLPPQVISKIRGIVSGCSNDREKVAKLYQYLGETTRYVSIQLGIGGFRPMSALEVSQVGFGDCKALSFYLKTMLEAVGIPSNYVVISTKNERLFSDFANEQQTNHVILQVPLPNDTLWLECTNTELPFGYMHEGIVGHDALVCDENGGRLVRLPAYPDSLNLESYNVHVALSSNGQSAVSVCRTSNLLQYEFQSNFVKKDVNQQKDDLRKQISLNQAVVSDIHFKEYKTQNPSLVVNYKLDALYGHTNLSRLFIPLNPFRKPLYIPTKNNQRTQNICIERGYYDRDTINVVIPKGYVVEGVLPSIDLKTEFGDFTSSVIVRGDTVEIVQALLLHKGLYDKEKWNDFVLFCEAVKKHYTHTIVLRNGIL